MKKKIQNRFDWLDVSIILYELSIYSKIISY